MVYDLYYHDDFDGRASAAVVLAFLKSRGDRVGAYMPMDYTIKPLWQRRDFFVRYNKNRKSHPAIVMDFLYHPEAVLWFDHHRTTFLTDAWKKTFRQSAYHCWDGEAPSCCGLILGHMQKHFGFKPPRHLRELARWLDIIDSARYRSARQTIEMKEPALQIGMFIETRKRGGNKLAWLIQEMSRRPLLEIVADSRVKQVVRAMNARKKKDTAFYKSHYEMHGKLIFTDLTEYRGSDLRFMPYFLEPHAQYGLVLKKRKNALNPVRTVFHVSFGVNPWHATKSRLDAGAMLRRYGGGGHKNAGGLELPTRAQVDKVKEDIIREVKERG